MKNLFIIFYILLGLIILFLFGYSIYEFNLNLLKISGISIVIYILSLIPIVSKLNKENINLKNKKFTKL